MDRPEEGARGSRATLFDVVAILLIPGALTAAIYLAPFVNDPTRMPFGNDTPGYIWRTNVVHDLGVNALTREATSNAKAHGERPGYPVVLSIIRSLTASDSLTIAWITPALFASAIALAFGSFVGSSLREPGRLVGAVGLAVAGSAFVAWTAVGYATNLAIDSVAVAAATVAARSAFGSRGRVAILVLLVGGALIHWAFALAIAILLISWTVVLCVWNEVARRRDRRRDGVSRRGAWTVLGTVVIAAAFGAIALLVIAPELPHRPPRTPSQAQARIEERLPDMALPISIPLAVAGFGIVALTEPKSALRRWSAGFLLIWASLAVTGLIAWHSPSLPAPPPYRTAGFALGIPALVVLGPLAARRWLAGRIGVTGTALGLVATAAATLWLTTTGARVWSEQPVHFTSAERGQLDTLSSYLEGVPDGVRIILPARPVVGAVPKFRVIAGLPPARAPFVRMPRRFIEPDAKNLGLHVGPLDPRTTVVVALRAFLPQVPSIGRLIGPGVWLIVGPAPRAVDPGEPARGPNAALLVFLWIAGLGALIVAGAGWSRGLTDLSFLGSLGLAPAFGLTALGLVGTIAGRLGVPLRGAGAIAVLVATAALGWMTVRVPRRYRARHA